MARGRLTCFLVILVKTLNEDLELQSPARRVSHLHSLNAHFLSTFANLLQLLGAVGGCPVV